MGTILCSYNPDSDKKIEYVNTNNNSFPNQNCNNNEFYYPCNGINFFIILHSAKAAYEKRDYDQTRLFYV